MGIIKCGQQCQHVEAHIIKWHFLSYNTAKHVVKAMSCCQRGINSEEVWLTHLEGNTQNIETLR